MNDEKVIEDLMQKVYPDGTPTPQALQYFVVTSDFDWGRGTTLDEAMENARFHLKLDWFRITLGYDLKPGHCGCADGTILHSLHIALDKFRKRRR